MHSQLCHAVAELSRITAKILKLAGSRQASVRFVTLQVVYSEFCSRLRHLFCVDDERLSLVPMALMVPLTECKQLIHVTNNNEQVVVFSLLLTLDFSFGINIQVQLSK